MPGNFLKVRKLLVFPILLLAALPLVVHAQTAPDEKTLVIAQSVDLETFDPSNSNSRSEANIDNHIFGSLYTVDDKGSIVPYLAKSYKLSDDGKEMTFTLNDGLTCQDGEALTAEDVAYTFQRAANPDNKFTGNTAGFVLDAISYADAKVVDPLNVTIVMKKYQSIALGLIAEVGIHCKDSYEKMTLEQAAESPIGSGPYKLVNRVKDDYIELEKWDGFKLFTPTFDRLIWRVIPENSTRVAELLAGNVDIAANVPADQVDAVNSSDNAKVEAVQGTRRIYVGFNLAADMASLPGADVIAKTDVRVALQYAIDVPTICKTLLGTECKRAATMVNDPNGNPAIEPYPYDPKKAGELLDAAGYPLKADGTRFEITFQGPRGRYLNDAAVVQAIAQYLTDVGVKVDLEIKDWSSEYVPLVRTHKMGPMFFLGTGGDTWSAIYDMSDISAPDASTNYTSWANPKWFELWNSLADIRDPAKEKDVVNQMLQVMHDDPPWIFLYMQPDFYGVSNRIEWQARRDEQIIVNNVTLKPA